MKAIVTDHAFDRMRERCGWNREAAQRMADLALEQGVRHGDTAGSLRRYLDKLYLQERAANNLNIYGAHVYVFKDAKLITVMHLDHRFEHAVHKIKAAREQRTAKRA